MKVNPHYSQLSDVQRVTLPHLLASYKGGFLYVLTVYPAESWAHKYWKSYQRILMKFYGELGCCIEINWLHFGDDPDHLPDPGVHSIFWNSHSLDYRKSYQRILMKFYGELGCGLETIHITIQIQESVPDPDAGRTATLSTHTEQMPCKSHSAILLCWHSAEVCALWVLLV